MLTIWLLVVVYDMAVLLTNWILIKYVSQVRVEKMTATTYNSKDDYCISVIVVISLALDS